MKAMVIPGISRVERGSEPLRVDTLPDPEPSSGQVVVKVQACGVCHTELDEIEGRAAPPTLPVVPGHEVVGTVVEVGKGVRELRVGDRVGVGWFYSSCGRCGYCTEGRPNLCSEFAATGRDAHGGYAEYMVAPAGSVYPIPEAFADTEAAPLLCAGGVGYRSLRLAGLRDGRTLGFYGFGASAHLVIQMARHEYPSARLCVFTRSASKQEFARELGAHWAGAPGDEPPEPFDALIDTTPVWRAIEEGMRVLAPGGRLVVNAIRKEDEDKEALLGVQYLSHVWLEKELISVANVTPADIRRALEVAALVPIRPTVETYPLEAANRALVELKEGVGRGAKVLVVD
jgi:propanol-preferring alcohol dehydrogenase